MDNKVLQQLSEEEWDMIIEGVEQLKHKDFAGVMMTEMLETMLLSPKKGASEEEIKEWAEHKRLKKLDEQVKEDEKKKYIKKVEKLKAKLILMKD